MKKHPCVGPTRGSPIDGYHTCRPGGVRERRTRLPDRPEVAPVRPEDLSTPVRQDEGYHFRFWVKKELEGKLNASGLRVEERASYGYLPFVDALTLYKVRTGKRRVFPIGERWEALFADRFVWLLTKTS